MKTIQVLLVICALILGYSCLQNSELKNSLKITSDNLESMWLTFEMIKKEIQTTNSKIKSLQDEMVKYENIAENKIFKIAMVRFDENQFGSIKWNRKNGQSYRLNGGKWVLIEESDLSPIKEGEFEITMVAQLHDWSAIRLNVNSGESWLVQQGKWKRNLTVGNENL